MSARRNDYDVTNTVRTTDPVGVEAEIGRIFHALYPHQADSRIRQAVADSARLFRGEYPGYAACDTAYHDLQHTLDVSLAMARIMAGYVRERHDGTIDADLFAFGVIAALFHDAGYIRRSSDTQHGNGAEYTKVHVTRGGRFLRDYLRRVGLGKYMRAAAPTLHFTGYERPAERIRVPDPVFRLIGNMLGSADIIAQMSDRCYLEKCYGRLYPEFVLGGVDRKQASDGTEQVVFASPEDLVLRTPQFYQTAMKRLHEQLDAMMRFAAERSEQPNLYISEAEKNIVHARKIARDGDMSALRRQPPQDDPGERASLRKRGSARR